MTNHNQMSQIYSKFGRAGFNLSYIRRLNGPGLARAAQKFGSDNHIDPTHIALNYGFAQNCWGVAVNAVKSLCAGEDSDQDFVRAMMKSGMDLENIHEDDLKVLENLIGE